MATTILGISTYDLDSAACLVRDGVIVAAAQEERFSRRRHDPGFPLRAIRYCLEEGGLGGRLDSGLDSSLDAIVFNDRPLARLRRLFDTYVHYAPAGFRSFRANAPGWLRKKRRRLEKIRRELSYRGTVLFTEHQESHAASAFFPSPFDEAAILTVDDQGELPTATIGRGEGNTVCLLEELHYPSSLGLLYSAFTAFAGFEAGSGEPKLLDLAPFGEPRFVDLILDEVVDLREDGSLVLNQRHFDFCTGLSMTSASGAELFEGPPREPGAALTQRDMDLACSIQAVTEEAMLRMARHAHQVTGSRRLVLAGQVALNCAANGRIRREGPFEEVWIQPAAGNAGSALGAAFFAHHQIFGGPRETGDGARGDGARGGGEDAQQGSLLGPSFDDDEIGRFLDREKIQATRFDHGDALTDRVARYLAEGKVVGWFQGRMELGPRALGARSILGDPRRADMRSTLNSKIRLREAFRSFAPAVLREHAGEWFDLEGASPYMLLRCGIHQDQRLEGNNDGVRGLDKLNQILSTVPAVTQVDGSARVQTVDHRDHPLFHQLLERFHSWTGCPVLINTSFAVGDEPIVCTPAEACRAFLRTQMDILVLGHWVLDKSEQKKKPNDPQGAGADRGEGRTSESLLSRLFLTFFLGLLFYVVLTPYGLLRRLLGKPSLEVRWQDGRPSFWKARKPGPFTVERYTKQL